MKLYDENPIVAVFFTVFVDLIGFGILIPIIPLLLTDPASEFYILPSGMTINQGYILLGLLIGLYSFMTFLSAPIIGQLSDKYGRKRLLIISLIGTGIGYIIFALGIVLRNIPLLFISRALDGITGGNISVAQAAIADVSKPRDKAKNFGLVGMAFGLGFILGPFIGGILSDPSVFSFFKATTPFYFAAILTSLNILSVIVFLPETNKYRNIKAKVRLNQSIHNILKAFTYPDIRLLFSTIFLFIAGFTFFTSFFGVFLIVQFNYTQSQIGNFFAYLGIWIALTQGGITRYLSDKVSSHKVVRIGLFGMGIALLLFFFPKMAWQLFLVAPFFAVFNGLVQANMTAIVSSAATAEVQGEMLGINASIRALAQAVPPVLSGLIAAQLTPGTPILVASTVVIIAGVTYLFYKPRKVVS